MLVDRYINEEMDDWTETSDVNNNMAEYHPGYQLIFLPSVDADQDQEAALSCEAGFIEDSPEVAHRYEVDSVKDEMNPMEVHKMID